MKKILFVFVFSTTLLTAQNWFPLEIGNTWQYFGNSTYVLQFNSWFYTYKLYSMRINSSTIINGRKYFLIDGFYGFPNNTLVRFDPDSQKVFIYKNNQENIFMEFNGTTFSQIQPNNSFMNVTVDSTISLIMNQNRLLKGFHRGPFYPYYLEGWYYFSHNLGFVKQIERYNAGLQNAHFNNFELIECLLYDSTHFELHQRHSYVPNIIFIPIIFLPDSTTTLKETFQILHQYSRQSWPMITGFSYISNAFVESYYFNGVDSIPNNLININSTTEIDFSLNMQIDTNLYNAGYKLRYRLGVKDKGIISSYYYKPENGYYTLYWRDTTSMGINIENSSFDYLLSQNYPNPFNSSTTIRYAIPLLGEARGGLVTLKVYDVLGNEVSTLVDEYKPAGNYEVAFPNVETRHGVSLPSGVYFYQLNAGDYIETKKMILLR